MGQSRECKSRRRRDLVYCKNCGKKLPDNARFCDRCNASVRKKEDKMDLIEELKEERLARRKAQDIESKIKEIKRVKSRRRRTVFLIIGIILGMGVVSGIIVYINYMGTSHLNQGVEVELRTESPTESIAPAVVIGGEGSQPTATDEVPIVSSVMPNAGKPSGYIDSSISGTAFAYPSGFEADGTGSGQLCVTDGEARITANKAATSLAPKELLRKYADTNGGEDMGSSANDTSYTVTLRSGDYICHRKGIVNGSSEIYYEMQYRADSEKASQYAADIEYMDNFFKTENTSQQ